MNRVTESIDYHHPAVANQNSLEEEIREVKL